MRAGKQKKKFNVVLLICLLFCMALAAKSICLADDHKEGWKQLYKHEHDRDVNGFKKAFGGKRNDGNETTGQIAAWGLGAINLTVAISLLIKGIKRFAPVTPKLNDSLCKFNHLQKKCLMPFHCYLNPVFVGGAVLHWTLSRCQSTALTEWGLLIMCFVAVLGMVFKFKLVSKASLRSAYRVHTQPVIFVSLIGLLIAGHLLMD